MPATSGPESYNLALSLRRPYAVEDALVRGGVPARAITVITKGESKPLVPTGTEFASRKISRLRSSSSRRRTNFFRGGFKCVVQFSPWRLYGLLARAHADAPAISNRSTWEPVKVSRLMPT